MQIKQGDTFAFRAEMRNPDGTVYTGPTTNLKCQVRDRSYKLVDTMTITTTGTVGTYLFTAGSTTLWPIGTESLEFDIRIVSGANTSRSSTTTIDVLRPVTLDE